MGARNGNQMLAAVIVRPGSMALRHVEIPVIAGDEVLVRVGACGICGTDFHIFGGHLPDVTFPIVPGHEAAGTVASVGPDAGDLQVGQRVIVEGKAGTGFTRDGAYAEYLSVPRSQIVPLANHVDFIEAALIDPLACAIHAVNRAAIVGEQRVAVVGQGSSGLCVLQALKALTSARVAVVDRHDDKLELARQFGADLALHSGQDDVPREIRQWSWGEGADRVIEVTGKAGGAALALSLVRPRGRLIIYGVFDGVVPLDLTAVTLSELEVVGAVGSPGTYPLAAELVASKRVDLLPIVSQIIPITEVIDLFSSDAHTEAGRKVVVRLAEE